MPGLRLKRSGNNLYTPDFLSRPADADRVLPPTLPTDILDKYPERDMSIDLLLELVVLPINTN